MTSFDGSSWGCGQQLPLSFDLTVQPDSEFRHALLIMSSDITNSKRPFFVCLNQSDDCDVNFLCCGSPTLRAIGCPSDLLKIHPTYLSRLLKQFGIN